MAIHLPESDEDDSATPLFKLENGVASSSAGLVCARAAGVNKRVVNRAKDIVAALRDGGQVPPAREAIGVGAPIPKSSTDVLRVLFRLDSWKDASENDIRDLAKKMSRM